MTMSQDAVLKDLQGKIGAEMHVSSWVDMTQEKINAFADATEDHQWIHIDAERATKDSPYGSTIAHGYFTLSLYPGLRDMVNEEKPVFPGVKQVINYGIDKLRFPNAVKVGSRVRARCELVSIEEVKGGLQMVERFTAEIDGEDRPACVADVVMRMYF
jgi:acyl dehydratase